jgi:hypothetical protein
VQTTHHKLLEVMNSSYYFFIKLMLVSNCLFGTSSAVAQYNESGAVLAHPSVFKDRLRLAPSMNYNPALADSYNFVIQDISTNAECRCHETIESMTRKQ